MTRVAEQYQFVVGIDTHARSHTYCLLQATTGEVTGSATFPASTAGNARATTWITRRAKSASVLAAVEGTSSYGAHVTEHLSKAGITVVEVRPAPRSSHAHTGKSDPIDAEAAARSTLSQDVARLTAPRQAGDRTALRVLLAARSLVDQQRTANRNALNALARTTDLELDARKPLTDAQIKTIAAWRIATSNTATHILRAEAKRLAIAIITATDELAKNHRALASLTEALAPGLQELPGVGPVTGAILVAAYSHHGRIRSEAAFAALGGIAPIPASSGNNTRYRLSRSGDRQLNRAVDVVVRTRMSFDPITRAYVERRRAEGRTPREIRRCLKRYVVRALFRQLQARMT